MSDEVKLALINKAADIITVLVTLVTAIGVVLNRIDTKKNGVAIEKNTSLTVEGHEKTIEAIKDEGKVKEVRVVNPPNDPVNVKED